MQTVPVFAYLVPILFLFGFGPVSVLIATIIYAMPPMVRITTLALRGVPAEIREFGTMVGCSPRQMTWRIMVPASRPGIMVGVDRKSTRLNSIHSCASRMPSSASNKKTYTDQSFPPTTRKSTNLHYQQFFTSCLQ